MRISQLILHFTGKGCINDKITPSTNIGIIIDELMKCINIQYSIDIIHEMNHFHIVHTNICLDEHTK